LPQTSSKGYTPLLSGIFPPVHSLFWGHIFLSFSFTFGRLGFCRHRTLAEACEGRYSAFYLLCRPTSLPEHSSGVKGHFLGDRRGLGKRTDTSLPSPIVANAIIYSFFYDVFSWPWELPRLKGAFPWDFPRFGAFSWSCFPRSPARWKTVRAPCSRFFPFFFLHGSLAFPSFLVACSFVTEAFGRSVSPARFSLPPGNPVSSIPPGLCLRYYGSLFTFFAVVSSPPFRPSKDPFSRGRRQESFAC